MERQAQEPQTMQNIGFTLQSVSVDALFVRVRPVNRLAVASFLSFLAVTQESLGLVGYGLVEYGLGCTLRRLVVGCSLLPRFGLAGQYLCRRNGFW
jgi:hypothetical protein